MAMKDWKRNQKEFKDAFIWRNYVGEEYRNIKNDSAINILREKSQKVWVFSKVNKFGATHGGVKEFKTKSQAMAFAKKYMSKH